MTFEILSFTAKVDVALVIITLAAFLINYESWARNADVDADLVRRLPKARMLTIALFAVVFFACWFANISLLLILIVVLLLGLILATLLPPAGSEAGCGVFLLGACLIREWAFGFPQLILNPPAFEPADELKVSVGMKGKTLSPLRPWGEVEVDGERYSATSDNGKMLAADIDVVVTGHRNGGLTVHLIDEAQNDSDE